MKKFVFTLAQLLSIKESMEEKQKAELKAVMDKIHLKTLELNKIENQIDELMEKKNKKLSAKSIILSELSEINDYIEFLDNKCSQIKKEIAELNIEKEKCQKKVLETMKERKALENLKEKQYKEYLTELQREQEKEIGYFVSFHTTLSNTGG